MGDKRTMIMIRPYSPSVCPDCEQTRIERIQRETWMRLLPKSRLYQCRACEQEFLLAFGQDGRER